MSMTDVKPENPPREQANAKAPAAPRERQRTPANTPGQPPGPEPQPFSAAQRAGGLFILAVAGALVYVGLDLASGGALSRTLAGLKPEEENTGAA